MKTVHRLSLVVGLLIVALLAFGCQTQSPAAPAETPTENIVYVVVTATSQPTFAATETLEPTITPLATFTPIATLGAKPATPTATRKPAVTAAPSTPRPQPTAAPTGETVAQVPSPTAIAAQNKYPAPVAIKPTAGDSYRDNSDIQMFFRSVGPLGTNECYALYLEMTNPVAVSGGVSGDWFFDGDHCGDQSPVGAQLVFTVYRGKFTNKPNYGTILAGSEQAAPTDLLKARWRVWVVQDQGLGDDGVHHKTVRLSPDSATLEFDFLPR